MIKIAIMNQKGGTGKTTSVVNIAGELTLRKKKVLIIDMDTQGNATSNLSLTCTAKKTLLDAVSVPSINIADTICTTSIGNLDIIPGGKLLGTVYKMLYKMPEKEQETVLQKLLLNLPKKYDFVLFDCSPSLESILNLNVLTATKYVLIPIRVDKNSIEGYDAMLDAIQIVRETKNPELRALGIFMVAVESGTSLDREMIQVFPTQRLAFQSYIRKNIDVKKAPLEQVPLCYYNARCAGAKDYASLTDEILTKIANWRD